MKLKDRIEKLEAMSGANIGNICLVLHSVAGKCETAREAAIHQYLDRYGSAPTQFIDVYAVGVGKGRVCGCDDEAPF